MTHDINLYDPSLLKRREWLTAANLAFALALVLVVMLGWGAWARIDAASLTEQAAALDGSLQAARAESVALASQLSNRRADPKLELDLAAMKELLGVRQQILTTLGQEAGPQSIGHADYLRGLARQSVGNLWLTGFAVGPDGTRMEIRGRTLDPALLPEYIRRLNAEPAFRGHRFAALNVRAPEPVPGANATTPAVVPPWLEFALVPELDSKAAGGAR
jgi:MSHA biogenesis protein MshI